MKRFLMILYGGLYAFIAVSLTMVEVASIKIGWPWLSTLVHPMGMLFLIVNVPLAAIAVIKIGHVAYLHSVQHHRNVMRSIREKDALPYSVRTQQQHTLLQNRPVARPVQLSSPDMDNMSTTMSSDVQDEDEVEAPIYSPMEEAIYHNEKNKSQHRSGYTDDQLGKRFGVSSKTIQRTRNDMRAKGKL